MSNAPYLKRASSGVYYVHWTEQRVGKRVSARTKDLEQAKGFFSRWLTLAHKGKGLPGVPKAYVNDLWDVYWKKHVLKEGVNQDAANYAWKNLQPHFGSLTVPEVSQMATDDYVAKRTSGQLGRKVKPQTCAKELSYLMACLHFAASPKQKLIPAAIIEAIELPSPGEPRDRWLRTEEIQRLLDAAAECRRGERLSRVERFLWIALETAARKSAIMELTWDRVDFETMVIDLNVPGRKKTNKRRAVVPISKALFPVLDRAYKERTGDLVMDNGGAIWAPIQHVVIKSGLAGKRAKVPAGTKPKSTGISPHVLRHTAATHMARRGVPLWIIAKVLGNSLAMVEKVYAKHSPDDLRAAVDTISGGSLEAAE
ncbi:MAG: tyrosine-type recombinase/integrase [Brucella intermedia]